MSLKRHLILWTIMVLCLSSHPVSAAQDSEPIDADRDQARERAREYLTRDDLLLQLQQVRRNLRDIAQENLSLIQQLETQANQHPDRLRVLLHRDDGKRLLRDPVSFMIYVQFDTDPAVTLAEVRRKRDEASSLIERAELGPEGRLEVGYLPTPETQNQIHALNHWAQDRLLRLQAQMDSLDTIVRRNTSTEDVSGAKTLAVALAEYNALWSEVLAQSKILGQQLAQGQKQQILIEANKLVELDRAEAEAHRIQAESDARLAEQKQDYELRLARQKTNLDAERQRAEEALQQQIDDLRNDLRLAQAQRELKNVDNDRQIEGIRYETERQRIIAELNSPEYQALLGPFIHKGYWQPNRANRGDEQSGISLQLLRKQNCFAPGTQGLQNLLTLGTNRANKERGPWTFPVRLQRLSPEQQEQVQKAQDYLRDYGALMVELGYLAP